MRHVLWVAALAVPLVAACGAPVTRPPASAPSAATASLPSVPASSPASAQTTPSAASVAASPTGAGSSGLEPSPPAAAATPTTTLPALGLPSIAVPAASLRTMASGAGLVTWGPRVYGVEEPVNAGPASVVITNLMSRTTTRVRIPLLAGETAQPPDGFWDPATVLATDGRWLAVIVWRRLGPSGGQGGVPCSGHEGQPVAWRLLVAPLSSSDGTVTGAFQVITYGTSRHEFVLPGQGEGCGGPRTPRVALSDGVIAYTVEESGAATPYATDIDVRSLPGGSLVRVVRRADEVINVALSGGALAFTESQNALDESANPQWAIWFSTSAHPSPIPLLAGAQDPGYVEPPVIALDGNLLAWQLPNQAERVVRVERLGSAAVQVVPHSTTCWLGGVSAGWVGLGCFPTGHQGPSYLPIQPVVWSTSTGLRQLAGVPHLVLNTAPALSDGWLLADGGSDLGPSGTLYGFPLAALGTSP